MPSKLKFAQFPTKIPFFKACQILDRLKLPKRAQLSPKSVKIGPKSGFFSLPSNLKFARFPTKITFFKACQNSRPVEIAKKIAKTGPTEPKKCQNWPQIRVFSSPSKFKFAEFGTKITFLKHAKFWLKLPKKLPKWTQKGPIRSFWQRSNLPLLTPPRFFPAVAFLMRFWPYLPSKKLSKLCKHSKLPIRLKIA